MNRTLLASPGRRRSIAGVVWLFALAGLIALPVHAESALPTDATRSAAPSEADRARQMLTDRLLGLGVFQAHFAQFVEGARGEIVEESTGELVLDRPRLRWQVDAPYPQIIVADQDRLRIYDPDLAQVLIKPMDEALQDTPIALLTDEKLSLSEHYAVVHLPPGDADEEEVFLITPLGSESLFQEVRLHFQGQALAQMLIFDQLGQYTTLKFRQVPGTGVLDSAVFSLDLPEDVDVIEG
jgi:outer membrane lipoprotein carrier protein